MKGQQVLNVIMVMMIVVVLLNVGAVLFAIAPFEASVAPEVTPAAAPARLPAALGVYQPPEATPSLLDSYPAAIAAGGGLLVFGILGVLGWSLFGSAVSPKRSPARIPQTPSHEPTPAPVTRLKAAVTQPTKPLLESPVLTPVGEPDFDKYGYPEGYADPDGFNWGFLFSGLSVLAIGVFLGTIILIGPMNIVFWMGLKLEAMGF